MPNLHVTLSFDVFVQISPPSPPLLNPLQRVAHVVHWHKTKLAQTIPQSNTYFVG